MNWTGGRRQRHSNSNTVTHRQKQHFAKIRSCNVAANSSPFQLRRLEPDQMGWEASNGLYGDRPSLEHPETFGQDETATPVVQRPTLMKPPPPHHTDLRRTIHDLPNTTFHPLVAPHEGNSSPTVRSYRRAKNGREPPVGEEHDLQKGNGRKRRASDSGTTDGLVERERDRLLARCDWAGLALSRPLHMRFSSNKDKEAIGKRRKTSHNKARTGLRDGAAQALLERADVDLGGPWMSGALVNNEDIDIRIGTDALATQRSMGGSDSHEVEYRLTPSDPILFDMKGAVQELQPVICAQQHSTAAVHSLDQTEEEVRGPGNPDTGVASRDTDADFEAKPTDDVTRLLQELDDFSYGEPATPRPTGKAVLTVRDGHYADSGRDSQGECRDPDGHEYLPRFLTSLQQLESGGEGNSPEQTGARGQTKEQLELPSSPPKPLLRPILCESRPHRLQSNSTQALRGLRSENSLELPEGPEMAEEGFDNVRWWEPLSIGSGKIDQSPEMRRPGSKYRTLLRGIGEDGVSSTALHSDSADRAARPGHSVDTPIDDAGHCANERTRWVEGSQFVDRSLNSTFVFAHATANASSPSCSSALHLQPPGRAPKCPSPGSTSQSCRRIVAPAENAPAIPAQGWIADADGGEEVEAVWKSFVLGDDSSQEERESPEPAIRSTLAPQWGTESSLFVEASGDSAAAGTATSWHAAHMHSDTAAASAGHAVTSGEEQASESTAFAEVGSTRAVASSEGKQAWACSQ